MEAAELGELRVDEALDAYGNPSRPVGKKRLDDVIPQRVGVRLAAELLGT